MTNLVFLLVTFGGTGDEIFCMGKGGVNGNFGLPSVEPSLNPNFALFNLSVLCEMKVRLRCLKIRMSLTLKFTILIIFIFILKLNLSRISLIFIS